MRASIHSLVVHMFEVVAVEPLMLQAKTRNHVGL